MPNTLAHHATLGYVQPVHTGTSTGLESTADLPLVGLRVVDSTDSPSWSSARLLADLGADVIRVERAHRRLDPLSATRHANKRSVVFEDADELRALLEHADVWFASVRHDLDVDVVRRAHPRLVVVSSSAFGAAGPYAGFAAPHAVVYALAGQLSLCRLPDRPPLLPPGQPAFEIASAMGAYLALVALWDRALTGTGDHIDLSMHEATIQTTDTALPGASVHGDTRGAVAPGHPAFPTRDGLVRPLVVSSRQWVALREWVGDPAGLDDEALATYTGRLLHPDVLRAIYEPLFAGTSTEDVCEEAQRRNVPATPVMSPAQLLASAPLRARGTFVDTVVEGRPGVVPSGYWEIDDRRVGFRRPASPVGADTDDVRAALEAGRSPFAGAPSAASPFTIASKAAAGQLPLSGIRVLEFTQLMAGPETGKLLRDHGAEVIRVESSAFPDQSRVFGGAANMSSQFVTINRGKLSFGVDLTSDTGRRLALGLVEQSDIVIENLGPGALDGLGLGVGALRAANPDVVVVSSQLFGGAGPWGEWRGFGSHARSLGGQTWLWRYPETLADFAENPIFFPDQFTARLAALAALACVGACGGRHIRVSQVDAVVNHLSELILQESLEPGSVDTRGNRVEGGAPGGVYPCAEDSTWCVITVRDDAEWAALVETAGDPAWGFDERFATGAGRADHGDELDGLIASWTATLTASQVMHRLQSVGVPAAEVVTPYQLLEDEHLHAHDFVQVILQPEWEPLFVEGQCFRAQHLEVAGPDPAPRHGEHTRDLAAKVLDLDASAIDALVRDRVLEAGTTGEPA
jgi:crotonobetainyl-CoA:carnitine CoA-transferase CaiB-like acyl-CoA transferase